MKGARLLLDMLNNPLAPLSGAVPQEPMLACMHAPMPMYALILGVLRGCKSSCQVDNIPNC